jgi:P-type conjugative transfer protein VirB9
MRRLLLLGLLLGLLVATGNAIALDVPEGSSADGRVKQIAYNEHDVVAVYSYPGIATQVVLGDGEGVLDMATGFSDGWELVSRRNIIYIKPKSLEVQGDASTGSSFVEPEPGKWDTNLIVTTARRTYVFQLFLLASRTASKKLEYDPRMAFRIQFTYPQAVAAQVAAAQARAVTADRLTAANPVRNLNYTMKAARKSAAIAPTAAYDDGRFTYLEFPPNGELPNVYLVDEDKRESLVNTHMSGDTLVIHRVAPKLMLRLGKQAVVVFNESYDPAGVASASGTTVPGVKRVLTIVDNNDAPAPPPMVAQAEQARFAATAAPAPTGGYSQAAPTPAASMAPPAPALTAGPIERVRIAPPESRIELAAITPKTRLPKMELPQVAEPLPEHVWTAEAGSSLRTTLLRWAKDAGWAEPRWDAPVDYPIAGTMVFEGDFLHALGGLFKAHANVSRPVHIDVYTTQKFIHVTE